MTVKNAYYLQMQMTLFRSPSVSLLVSRADEYFKQRLQSKNAFVQLGMEMFVELLPQHFFFVSS